MLRSKTSLKSKSSLKTNTRINPQSPSMKIKNLEYSKKSKIFLKQQHYCQMCILSGVSRPLKAIEVHHREGRGKNLLMVHTWVPICRKHHNWIGENPKEARKLGWLV